MKACKFQRPYKGAAIYVESTTTMHNLLFVFSSYKIQIKPIVVWHGQG